MKLTTITLLGTLSLAAVFAAASARATVIFTDDFNSYTAGNLTGDTGSATETPGVKWRNPSATDDDHTVTIASDTSNFFSHGGGNKYLSLVSAATGKSPVAQTNRPTTDGTASGSWTNAGIGTLSFDFYQPTVANPTGSGWMVRLLNQATTYGGNSNAVFGLFLSNGTLYAASTANVNPASTALASFALNRAHTLSVVFNTTSTARIYGNDSEYTLAANSMDIWLDGSRVGTALGGAGGKAGAAAINKIDFTTKSTISSLFVDNLVLDNTLIAPAPVPEPATVALATGAVALAGALVARRRHRRGR
ncbi:hypothetical protein OpiT1DRAFT_04327 [Opitutaceae bacterium TAV1]|nr:hypothetical protein OpiT1DRAFT_04327 [Opitutaceae bacterium TAV1]